MTVHNIASHVALEYTLIDSMIVYCSSPWSGTILSYNGPLRVMFLTIVHYYRCPGSAILHKTVV